MKVLFIPHVPNRKIINRVYEFAKNSESYFLDWEIDNSSLKNKLLSQIKSFFKTISLQGNILRIPMFFKPEYFSIFFNTLSLNYAINKYKIDIVVNANALLFDIKKISVPVIYDLVDDHLTENGDIGLNKKRIQKIKRDIQNSNGVVCVTNMIEEKVKKLNSNSLTIENGLYLEKFRNAKSLKKELGLDGKKVFGYIGGVDQWTGIEKACEAYVAIKNDTNAMIVVGNSKSVFFSRLKEKYKNDILFTGLISPDDVGNYFKTLDVGLIPFVLNDFTNNAYPIKALEYGLAGASVISTELKVLKSKQLPYIKFCEIEKFPEVMKNHIVKDFDFDFSKLSWKKQTEKLIHFIEKRE